MVQQTHSKLQQLLLLWIAIITLSLAVSSAFAFVVPSCFPRSSSKVPPSTTNPAALLHQSSHERRISFALAAAALPPQSLPPINSDMNPSSSSTSSSSTSQNISSLKDYFLPTSSEEATRRALEEYVKNKQQSVDGTMIKSEDFIQFDTAMPGVKGSKPIPKSTALLPTPTYNKEIDKREILWISQQFDIYLRRLPQAVFLYALLDFFVLPTSRSVISDELEEDRLKVAGEWASRAVFRVGVFSAIVAVTSLYENLFYHPI